MELMRRKKNHLPLVQLIGGTVHLADHFSLVHIGELPERVFLPPELELLVLFLIQNSIEGLDVDIRYKSPSRQNIGGGGDDLRRLVIKPIA